MDPTDLFIQGLAKAPDREYGMMWPVSWKKGTPKEDYKLDWKGGVTGDTGRALLGLMKGMDTGAVDPVDVITAGLGMGSLATRPAGSLGMFGRRATSDAKVRKAANMASKGAGRDDIWAETQMYQAPEGGWIREFDDSSNLFDFGPLTDPKNTVVEHGGRPYFDPRQARLPDVIKSDIYQEYPELKSIKIGTFNFSDPQSIAGFDPTTRTVVINKPIIEGLGETTFSPREGLFDTKQAQENIAKALTHETQHAVQTLDGRSNGADPMSFLRVQSTRDRLVRTLDTLKEAGYTIDGSQVLLRGEPANLHEIPRGVLGALRSAAHDLRDLEGLPKALLETQDDVMSPLYYHNWGEVEANSAMHRLLYPQRLRELSTPWPYPNVNEDWIHTRTK